MTQEYQVGHRKPPKHTQFKKGQSGNPSGKPGPAKSLQARLKLAISESLEKPIFLLRSEADTSLEDIARRLVRAANSGDIAATKLLLAMMEKIEPAEDAKTEDVAATNAPQTEDKSSTNSLPQGDSQGDFSKKGHASGETVAEQGVEPPLVPPSGSIEGTAHKIEDVVPPRPKRPTIWIAGELVQQGD